MRWLGSRIRRRGTTGTAVCVGACALAACGAAHTRTVTRTETVAPGPVTSPAQPDDVLSLSGLGMFVGRCPAGARTWTLKFVATASATDTVAYRVGAGPQRTVNTDPGRTITMQLVPNATSTHEPADRFVPPIGQGRGVTSAMSVRTTEPVQAVIYQATEPQTLQADVKLALSSIGGESEQCTLVGSTVKAYTYSNG